MSSPNKRLTYLVLGGPSAQRFIRDNGIVAAWVAALTCKVPLLVFTVIGLAVGAIVALPGLALAMVLSVPHWLRRPRGEGDEVES